MKTVLLLFLTLVLGLFCACEPEKTNPSIPQIPKDTIRDTQKNWGVSLVARGHVTEDEQKIPLIRFESYEPTTSISKALGQYKGLYLELVQGMSHQNDSINEVLFRNSVPRVCLSLVFADSVGKRVVKPYVAHITMGPAGQLIVSSIDPKTDRYDDIGESSLRELFAEELASDKGK